MEELGLDIRIIFLQAINFVILLWILKKFLYRPIIDLLEKRRTRIEAGLAKSEEIETRLKQIEKEREEELKKVRQEAREIVEKARQAAEDVGDKIKREAKHQAENQLKEATERIEAREKQLMQELREDVVDLAVQAAEKVVADRLPETKQRELVAEALHELEKEAAERP